MRSKVLHQPFHEVAVHSTVQEAGRPSRNGTANGTVSPKGKFFIKNRQLSMVLAETEGFEPSVP
jgi:hypothetical protein